MTKIYAVPVTMYVKAFDERMAKAVVEINCFSATSAIRRANSEWVTDDTTIVVRAEGEPFESKAAPTKSYCKKTLIDAFGEDRAISFLNAAMSSVDKGAG